MPSHQSPAVLIFAQSGRFLAQSAHQAGYKVWVVDCFGDIDTLAVADRWLPINAIATVSEQVISDALIRISNDQPCLLICGSGIEAHFQLLNSLPPHITLVGNHAQTIDIIKTPRYFFTLLDQLNIDYPEISLNRPEDTSNWVIKASSGFGGNHVQFGSATPPSYPHYYQRFVDGSSGSALFLSTSSQTRLVSINKQFTANLTPSPFTLSLVESPWHISIVHQQLLVIAIQQISQRTSLVGFNSIDFIINTQGQLFVLEINPRPSASMQLIHNTTPLIQQHIEACRGRLANQLPHHSSPPLSASLRYFFADDDYVIPPTMMWPDTCHDLPISGKTIKKNHPICSSLVHCQNKKADDHHCDNQQNIMMQLQVSRT